ncbi:MAG: type IV pilus twitching motility protein PilT [Planctomycetota bacterium]
MVDDFLNATSPAQPVGAASTPEPTGDEEMTANPLSREVFEGALEAAARKRAERAAQKAPQSSQRVKVPAAPPVKAPPASPGGISGPTRLDPAPTISGSTKLNAFSVHGWLDELLARVIDERGSDLHVISGERPRIRVGGRLQEIKDVRPLVAGEIHMTCSQIIPAEFADHLEDRGEVDFSYTHPGGARFRVNAFKERRGIALALRRLAERPYTFDELGLPKDIARVIYARSGLVLFVGHAGAGKTSTMFSVLQEFCDRRTAHVITLEDPIEYSLKGSEAYVEQRELGRHFHSYKDGVLEAMRASPDVLAMGELRDWQAIRLALQAAEAGLLVFATVHAYDCTRAVNRVIDAFPPDQQLETRIALAYTVRMMVAQTLLRLADRRGRVPAVEIVHGTNALSTLIREHKEHEIPSLIEASRGRGMRTLDQSLLDLVASGLVTPDEAVFRAVRKDNVERVVYKL